MSIDANLRTYKRKCEEQERKVKKFKREIKKGLWFYKYNDVYMPISLKLLESWIEKQLNPITAIEFYNEQFVEVKNRFQESRNYQCVKIDSVYSCLKNDYDSFVRKYEQVVKKLEELINGTNK